MVVTLEKRGLISRTPGEARSIRLLVPAEDLPTFGAGTLPGATSPTDVLAVRVLERALVRSRMSKEGDGAKVPEWGDTAEETRGEILKEYEKKFKEKVVAEFAQRRAELARIEERADEEVSWTAGLTAEGRWERVRTAPEGTPVRNWAFDVTPAAYLTGILTERGIVAARPEAIAQLMRPAAAGV
jgi:hypothetical protein